MTGSVRSIRLWTCLFGIVLALCLGACGGGDDDGGDGGGSEQAAVGDCIDADNNVVDCDSSEAAQELVSDQSEPDRVACLVIDEPPQVTVEVDGTPYCAEPLE